MDRFITVGIAGHVDHGKTSLVRSLTGIDTDRLKEEKRRGLSIEPSVAPLRLPSGHTLALVDVPGHSDYLKNTIRGLSSVDMAVLVVAADDGVMPQTRDHLEVLNFVKARGGFIVLSKADLVDDETIDLAEMEIRDIVKGSFLEGKPVIPFSAMKGCGLQQILQAMEIEAENLDSKAIQAPFRLCIDRVRSFPGFGTVASGTVASGTINQDDTVELLPSGKEVKVRFLEVHHQRVEKAVAGQRAGLNLQNVSLQEVRLGTVIATPGLIRPSRLLNADLTVVASSWRPVMNRQRVKLYLGTDCTSALLVMMQNERLYPGETGLVQLRLQEPLAVVPRDPFVIAPMNLHTVVAGGKVLEVPREKFRSSKAEKTLSYLQSLRRDDVQGVISLHASKVPGRPVTAAEIASATGLPPESIQAAIDSRMRSGKLLYLEGSGYFEKAQYKILKTQLLEVAKGIFSKDPFKLAASSDEIRFRLDPNLNDLLFERALGELCKEEKLTRTDKGYRVPNFVVKFPSYREKLIEKVVEFTKRQGYNTFTAGTFWKRHGEGISHREVEKVVDHLYAQKKLVRLNDNRFLTVEALEAIKEKVSALILRKGSLTIEDGKEILGYGRNRAVPLLDYLDSVGFTQRRGDKRVLRPEDSDVRSVRL
jgi:selenocysteine-specific elongation factor